MLDDKNRNLIATIYAATLSPQGFDEVADDLEHQVTQVIMAFTGHGDITGKLPPGERSILGERELSGLGRHIETARQIQTQIAHPDKERETAARFDGIVDMVPSPAILFDHDERIVRANAASAALGGGRGATLAAIFEDDMALADIRRAVAAIDTRRSLVTVPISRNAVSDTGNCAIVRRLSPHGGADRADPLYMLSMADCAFDDTVRAHFRSTYGLTDAEAAVAVLLAGGAKADEIAERRGVSRPTVRAQIRAIKSKTQARHLPDLVRLLCGFAIGIAVQRPQGPAPGSRAETASRAVRTFRLPDGRRLDYLPQGDPDGAPVLLFHNLPHGVTLPAAANRYARRHGLRVIAPYRPGHGYSDPLPHLRGMAYFDQVADDIARLCAHLSIRDARLLGIGGGSNFATRFARRHPGRASAIVMVGHAPMWYPARYWRLPQRYRAQWLLNKYMPELGTLYVGTMMPDLGVKDFTRFAKQSCGGSPPDIEALDDGETVALLRHDTRFGLRQGPETHAREALIIELDMTDDARALPHPLHLIHGAQDRILTPDFSREFARTVPRTTLDIVENGGYHIFHSHWRRAMDALLAR